MLAALPAMACPRGEPEAGMAAGVSAWGEIALEGGAQIHLAHLDRTTPNAVARLPAALAELGVRPGAPLFHVRLRTEPDRWGRIVSQVVLPKPGDADGPTARRRRTTQDRSAGDGVWLEEALVRAGMMRVAIDSEGRDCVGRLLAAEDEARKARRGSWDGEWSVLPVTEPAAILARSGENAIVAGRIRSVGVRRERTFLNFGTVWTEDVTVSIPRVVWAGLVARGVDVTALTGKTVRVRGRIEENGGPLIALVHPEQLELVD